MMKDAWHRAQCCGAPLSRYVLPFTIICTSSSLNVLPANVTGFRSLINRLASMTRSERSLKYSRPVHCLRTRGVHVDLGDEAGAGTDVDRYLFALRGREAALIASRGKRKMRCEIFPSCDLFSKDSAACPARRKEHFRRLTRARVQLPLSPPRSFLAGPVSDVPLVPHAPCVVPTRRHHALFVRGEAAVGGTPVVDTPWTIDFGN